MIFTLLIPKYAPDREYADEVQAENLEEAKEKFIKNNKYLTEFGDELEQYILEHGNEDA